MAVSPLAPKSFPTLPAIAGVELAVGKAGVKYQDRTDVMVAVLKAGTSIAGVFTKSSTRSSAVEDCVKKIGKPSNEPAVIVVNSGNANAFTGRQGQASVDRIVEKASSAFRAPKDRIFTSSTGVIGEPLPDDKISDCLVGLDIGSADFYGAAEAIRTTDTFAKGASKIVPLEAGEIKIVGIAKGSGMIAPDMATMLVYIFTDALINQKKLQTMISGFNEKTFNAITVDSDTSTSDTLLCAATGASGVDANHDPKFGAALKDVMLDLAHQVVRDGEGATKFVDVQVTGAASEDDANKVARSIANSPLVKTAIAGEDPNWGRVVMAVGKSGAKADRDLLSIWFGDILVAENGWVSATYSELAGSTYMKNQDLTIKVDLGLGNQTATVWTCDLTHGYISINADYRS